MVSVTSAARASPRWPALRLALRELRGGVRGFGVFIACIALGVTAIAGVGSASQGLLDGLAREGRVILGGDLSFTLIQREAQRHRARRAGRRGRRPRGHAHHAFTGFGMKRASSRCAGA